MTFEEAMRKVARRAEQASKLAMEKLASGRIKHEDDLTPALATAIEMRVNNYKAGGVTWDASVLTHRASGEEAIYGADLLIHVTLDTPQYKYSKGVLIQAKRVRPGQNMRTDHHNHLQNQCKKMIQWSAASFVFAYDPRGMRAGSATKISGATDRALYDQCNWTAYRFFLELFRCPIGDAEITTAEVDQLPVRVGVAVKGEGDLDADRLEDELSD